MASTKSHKVHNLLAKGLTPTEVVARLKVSRSMVYKIKNEMVGSGVLSGKVKKEVGTQARPTPTLHTPPPAPTPSIAGLGAFHANKPVVRKQEVAKPKTLWQFIKGWFK